MTEPLAAFARRAERARLLARGSATAREPLLFAAGLYQVQGTLAAALDASHRQRPLTGRPADDLAAVVRTSAPLLAFVAHQGPPTLAGVARSRSMEAEPLAASRLASFWSAAESAEPDHLSRALLRPYLVVLAALGIAPDRELRPGRCPFCGGAPWIAARRSDADADGAGRFLGCALCGGEWPFARIRCPACAEEDPERLPSFRAESYPEVRLEACETCRRYVKSIDLTVEAKAIPEVDDLLSLAMDLWASQQGYERIEPALAGF